MAARNQRTTVLLTDGELTMIRKAATAEAQSVASYMRTRAVKAAAKEIHDRAAWKAEAAKED